MRKAIFILSLVSLPFIFAISKEFSSYFGAISIPASVQRTGDAAKGYEYLTTGDFLKSGVPYGFFTLANGKDEKNRLNREGKNAKVGPGYNVINRNGSDLVVPTCLQCHSQVFNDKLIVGLGNTSLDFTNTKKINFNISKGLVKVWSGKKYAESKDFLTAFATSFPHIQTEVRGVNVATKLAMVLVAHRDPQTLVWSDSALIDIPDEVYPTDVPAWWLLKYKNAMFYSGFARGDMVKFLMLANLLTVKDSTEAREVSDHFSDVLAFIRTVEPPKFPRSIDQKRVAEGKVLFSDHCSSCHGTYGSGAYYPNLLIPNGTIGTDSTLSKGFGENEAFVDWFSRSWFGQGVIPAQIVPFEGYVAPPLYGVWVTAPYLHNGSVPTLDALLNSRQRPMYWSRDFKKQEYDYKSVGWKYTLHSSPGGKNVYNTMLKGYRNSGHYFGDLLSDGERKSVIEYLKTL